jgi:hypothetical protein
MTPYLSSRKLGEPVAKQRSCEPYYPGPKGDTLSLDPLGPGSLTFPTTLSVGKSRVRDDNENNWERK